MADSDSIEITLDVATEANPNENMRDNSEQEEENMSRETKRQSRAFSGKVMSELIEMHFRDDMAFVCRKKMRNLIKMLESSSVDGFQFCGNEKMHELMEKQFCSSTNDMPFHENRVHIMCYELYEAASDKNADADRFVYILEQGCAENKVDVAAIFNHVTPTGDSLLHVAAQHGSEQVLCLNAFHYPKLLCQTNMKGNTPLHVAARAKNLLAIKNILDLDKHFMTSEEVESMDKMEFIMLRNNDGRTALHEAVLSKDYSVVLFLLVAQKRSDLVTYWTWNYDFSCKSPMYLAVLIRDEDILYLLLRLIPIPSGKTMSNGDSQLHAAISERTKGLLKKIADTRIELLYQRDENNNTPFHYAAYSTYMEGVCMMLETSPMIAFQRNSDGNLPIHLACKEGNVEVVKKLLEMDWSNNAGLFLDHKGQNILHIAAMKGRTHGVKNLVKHPKIHHDTINERDVNGDTPLHLASRELRLWTLLLLSQDQRIDVNLVNNNDLTARDVVWTQHRIPETRQELLANVILYNAGVDVKANMLSMPRTTSINKEWNVKDAANTLILVAILIATMTFAAGFTVPGGFYSSDCPIPKQKGMALLADQTLFKIFMAFNTIAMYSSIIGSIILLWVPIGDHRTATRAYKHALLFLWPL
ncbi:protein ACCELERATED CELL DEATH 6-like [Neltuma alba]|uniref:protein ACCELERATED CELL DEATH 6-like n=1 Tax=Neltuma alba TaxID=207710 RepID=UPI0010A37D2B|nr:protein ACCELERATED CELL DEATH 6-like [Prosopis alba]